MLTNTEMKPTYGFDTPIGATSEVPCILIHLSGSYPLVGFYCKDEIRGKKGQITELSHNFRVATYKEVGAESVFLEYQHLTTADAHTSIRDFDALLNIMNNR